MPPGQALTYYDGEINVVDFAQELGDYFAVMERGAISYASTRAELDEGALKRAMAI